MEFVIAFVLAMGMAVYTWLTAVMGRGGHALVRRGVVPIVRRLTRRSHWS